MSQESVKATLLKAIEGVQGNPAAAKVVFRADTRWEEDVRCTAQVRSFPAMVVDEPPELAGTDTAPNPAELLLVALGTCQEIVYSAYASVMGVPLNGVQVKVKGYLDLRGLFGLDAATPPGYQKVTFETQIDSPADDDTLRQLVETVESHCPVLDTLMRAIEVRGSVNVNGRTLPARAQPMAA